MFFDNFDRDDSTNLGADWNEVVGDWGIYGWDCVEDYSTLTDGTANAVLITTQEEPAASAGEQVMSVDVYDPQTGDIYYLYPCCTTINSVGPVEVKFECVTAPSQWHVSVGSIVDQDFTVTAQDGYVRLAVCADTTVEMVKAWVNYGINEPVWEDSLDPGTGRFSGFGHDNTGHLNVFNDYEVHEIRLASGVQCDTCFCYCRSYAPDKTLTLTLTADPSVGTNRAACVNGATCTLTWDWNSGIPWWTGFMDITGPNGVTWRLRFYLKCGTEDPNEYQGKNFTLSHALENDCQFGGSTSRATDASTCVPFSLVFGPYSLVWSDLSCFLCQNPMTGPTSGTFLAVVTP